MAGMGSFEEEIEVHGCKEREKAFRGEGNRHSWHPFSLVQLLCSPPLLIRHRSQWPPTLRIYPHLLAAAPFFGQIRVCWSSCDSPNLHILTLTMNTGFLNPAQACLPSAYLRIQYRASVSYAADSAKSKPRVSSLLVSLGHVGR